MPRFVRRSFAILAVAALALALPPATARAADEPQVGDGIKKLGRYISCAGSIAFAPTLPAAGMAFMGCINLFIEEMSAL